MTTQVTVNYGWIYPDPFSEEDTWAPILNTLFNKQDTDLWALKLVVDGKQPLDADLTSIAALAGTSGSLIKTAANTWALDTASYQLLDADLTAIAALAGTSGSLIKTAANTWALDTNTYQLSDGDLTAIAALTGTGLPRRTGANTWVIDNSVFLVAADLAGYQPLDGDLTAIAALGNSLVGNLRKTAANTWAIDSTVYSTAADITAALAGYQPLDGDLTAIAAIAGGSVGVLTKTGANTWITDPTDMATQAELDDANKTIKSVNGGSAAITLTPTLHAGKTLRFNTAGANVLTIQPDSVEAWPSGARVELVRATNPSDVTIVGGAGVTLNSADAKTKLRTSWSGGTLWRQSADNWVLFGDLA